MPPKQIKGEEAETLILHYLNENYRPFAINDIVQNLHNSVSKTNAVRALETLASEKKISCKPFGKILIYVRNEIPLEDNEANKDYTFEAVQELNEEYARVTADSNEWETKLASLNQEPTNDELVELLVKLDDSIFETQDNIQYLENKTSDPSMDHEIKFIQQSQVVVEKEIKARRRIWKSCVQLVKHGIQPSDINEFLEEIGCDLDQD